jgi:hypothetical protein
MTGDAGRRTVPLGSYRPLYWEKEDSSARYAGTRVRNDQRLECGFDVEVRSPYRAWVDPPREIDAGEAVEE